MEKADRLSRTASVAYTKGLLNNPGENNCFLNSAVQVLWHLDVFRRSFREISGHFCVGESCIFCALKVIFTQIQYSDEAALPPDALRQALAVTFKDQQRFQLQDMDDAAECLENILNRLHFHFAMNERDEICCAPHCISHRKFSMEIMEQSICNCGATSEPLPFSQLVHYVSVSALRHEADVISRKLKGLNQDNFGHLLKRAVNQDVRACPGMNCGKKISVQQSLLNCPDVVCIGLIWDSESPEVQQITQLLDCIDPVLRLPEVFPRVVDDTAKKVELLLSGVVTYYGKHYSTFFYSNKLKNWIYFDDARVRKCGSEWETIRKKCCQNHYQPLLLLFVNPHGKPVNTTHALSEVKLVDSKTLLASQEHNRSRTSFTNEKASDRNGDTLSVVHEHKGGESVDGLLSSSSSHSVGSDRGSEKDVEITAPERKKSKRSLKKLRGIGSDIKSFLSRSRNNSPTSEINPGTLDTEKIETTSEQKKRSSSDDLINFSDDPKPKITTRGREVDEIDSGLGSGSSEASSPAASSVSSVDTTTDDLIDFTSRTFPRPSKLNDVQLRLDAIIDDAESLLRRSCELERADPALSLSLATNAATRFRIAVENFPSNQSPVFLARLKDRHSVCLERSRNLHSQLQERNSTTMQFSTQQKEKLINNQKERDQQVLKEMKQVPTMHGTLPKSFGNGRVQMNEVVPMSSRSITDLYLNNHSNQNSPSISRRSTYSHPPGSTSPSISRRNTQSHPSGSTSPSVTRRSNSRIVTSGTRSRPQSDEMSCTQKIKPDVLCYSPVHYGKTNGLNSSFERLDLESALDRHTLVEPRNTTVTHVSTSFIPVRSLPVDQMLATSTVLPNSRNPRDVRRCSIYDNMPPSRDPKMNPSTPRDNKMNSHVPQRTSSYSNNRPHSTGESRRSCETPVYIEPPPYSRAAQFSSKNQNGSLLQRFNVPATSRNSENDRVPDDVRRINEDIRSSRRLCQKCGTTYVEKNAIFCQPCMDLNHMLRSLNDNTAMQY